MIKGWVPARLLFICLGSPRYALCNRPSKGAIQRPTCEGQRAWLLPSERNGNLHLERKAALSPSIQRQGRRNVVPISCKSRRVASPFSTLLFKTTNRRLLLCLITSHTHTTTTRPGEAAPFSPLPFQQRRKAAAAAQATVE